MPQMILLLLFLVNSALLSINGVTGLPDINKHGSTINKHSTNKHNVNSRRSSITNSILSGGQRTSLVTLTDEFPCEESASSSSSSAVGVTNNNNHQSAATPPSTGVSFTGNSFAEMNNIQMDNSNSSSSSSSKTKSSLTTRGGGGSTDVMDDDEIDQMVEHLISGLDNDQVEEESEEEESDDAVESEEEEESEEETEEEVEEQVDGSDESEEDEQIVSVDQDGDEAIEEEEEEQEEESAEEEDSIATKADDTTSVDDSSNSRQQFKPDKTTPPSPNRTNNNNRPPLPLATPTNAYYRFLVRRGPKGHIFASLTLISIQWIQVYVPLLYKSAASILLKLHIYDPNVLWKRDRLRREEEDRRRRGIYPQKKGVMGVFSKKDASQKKERNAQQQRADLQASQTLKQLYKAIKSGEGSGGALSEVKYRYLSAAFRRKYGLGKEYRVEKPMSFLGEVLEGDAHQRVLLTEDAVVDEVVFSDGEEDGEEVVESADNDDSTIGQSAPKQKRKRKKVNDWVVQAFGNRNKQPPKPSPQGSSSGKQQYFESALWKTVDNSAIMQAAWESRAAEQLAWQKKKRTKQRGSGGGGGGDGAKEEDESEEEDEESLVKSGGYGASKMFQSVMTRVGSNGRLPGAYPMDAPPIEECADNRGVVDLARRYGYGDWKESSIYYGEEDSEDEEGSFGGGDLFSVETASQGRKSRRRKKQRSTPVMDATDDNDTAVKRRKRRKKSSSVKLGFSGGGVSWDNSNRVSFEFGVSSSPRASSRRQRNPPAMSPLSNSRRTELNDIKSKLSERSSLFTPDTRVKAPTELLHTSRDRLRKKRSEDES
eukprot:CAMPEP_0113378154 /NCGR_PEP_ID=MMETSP0013_2-20120614/3542_1 /TAXON_ID=2843 ORGANISM="Skeletonema costatum, Strain 1716" /NCGR_SAMPLE_ID=MMETSP0013_2 /ASSEMBLY_ACC=CAM_ASM_000158 /LENGTH=822 /DNA_ID=CAMNT_0000260345 /DNA_START=216 /DNA_END=2684 /DNA_ORIENTATION=+ /assembly_acc=CAM_ASM_000158